MNIIKSRTDNITRNQVVLVDESDNNIGVHEKISAHEQGLLHRAFSVMLYRYNKKTDKLEFLLQKRASNKYHCPGLWTNTCCSHPELDSDVKKSALKRLKEELVDIDTGIIDLQFVNKFIYKATMPNGLIEHELDYIYVGEYNKTPVSFAQTEVEELAWLDIEYIKQDCINNPRKYTMWFSKVLDKCIVYLCN